MESEVDPLDHDNTYILEENNSSSKKGNLPHLEVTGMKTACVDHSYEIKSETKVEDSAVPTSFAFVKCEVNEYVFDLDRVKQEVSIEEDKVLTESIVHNVEKRVSREQASIDREEEDFLQCASNRPDCSNISDVGHNCLKCNKCNDVFVTSQSPKLQIYTIRNSLKCDVCGNCFPRLSELNRHVRIHTGERPFKCEVCGKCFSQIGHLTQHVRIHTGERPFKCKVCGKCFSQIGHLTQHVRIHTGELPFKCDVCGKCFPHLGHLTRHIRFHTGERPLKCAVCGKSSGDLDRHARIHPGERPFKCELCGKTFLKSSALRRHAHIHTGESH
ncbi:zinc finger protein 678-like [Periplaneta americana]|uniref:zinc finger protein 678-like n=1 Tax=Periplaneta americana TaxID=6978 RepID=UPI0037E73782